MPLTQELIDAAVTRYWREIDRYEKLGEFVGKACRSLLEEHGIRGLIQWRTKDPSRLKEKLQKYLRSGEHAGEFTDLDTVFLVLKDLAGVRITTYVETDRARAIALVQKRFNGFGANPTVFADVKDSSGGLYRATHCMVGLKNEDLVGQYQNLRGLGCEIQVCSQLAHVYNEFEHDIRYKPLTGALSEKENDLLNALARLMEVGDTIINHTRDAVESRQQQRPAELVERDALKPTADGRVRNSFSFKVIADSPILLTLASLVQAGRPKKDLPDSPAAFYREMMSLLATGGWRDDATPPVISNKLLDDLPAVAWRLFSLGVDLNHIDRNVLFDVLAHVRADPPTTAALLVRQLVSIGFLEYSAKQHGEEYYRFRHASFCEYLAACHIASHINRDGWHVAEIEVWQNGFSWKKGKIAQLIDAHAFEAAWESIIVFVAELMNEPVLLIEMLTDRTKDDLYRHRLGLFCRCYRVLGQPRQKDIAPRLEQVFKEILRIARRCEHDDAGHRKPWLEWVEMLLSSGVAAEYLVNDLLKLSGRYHGWAVSLKVLELFERVLVAGSVSSAVIEAIARFSERDEHQWGVNTARLALRLSDDHSRQLSMHFADTLKHPQTSDQVKVRLAEAVAIAGDSATSKFAGELLILMAQNNSLAFELHEQAVSALISLLETPFAPVAASMLVGNLLDPSSRHYFWLAWRIIGNADRNPDSPWSPIFLAITLFADRDNDQRLKLWSAQVLSSNSQRDLRDIGCQTLWELVLSKSGNSWVYAARWLVEHGPIELAEKARKTLFNEASDHDSDGQRIATAELLEMKAIDPLGGSIERDVREAVRRELEEHGQKYGSRLHLSAPGAPKENVDFELFNDNPAAVIKLLHSFHGPSPYLRNGGDPNEEKKQMRNWNAMLLHGTRYWPKVFSTSVQAVHNGADPDRDGALGIVLYGASGSDLVDLLQASVTKGNSAARTRHYLLEELDERGWRFRIRGRQIDVLCKGRSESQAFADA